MNKSNKIVLLAIILLILTPFAFAQNRDRPGGVDTGNLGWASPSQFDVTRRAGRGLDLPSFGPQGVSGMPGFTKVMMDSDWYNDLLLFSEPTGWELLLCLMMHNAGDFDFDVSAKTWSDYRRGAAGSVPGNKGPYNMYAAGEKGPPIWDYDYCGDPMNATDVCKDQEGFEECKKVFFENPADDSCAPFTLTPIFVQWRITLSNSYGALALEDKLYYSVYIVDNIDLKFGEEKDGISYKEGRRPEAEGQSWADENDKSYERFPGDSPVHTGGITDANTIIFMDDPQTGERYDCSTYSSDERDNDENKDHMEMCTVSPGGYVNAATTAYVPTDWTDAFSVVVMEGNFQDNTDALTYSIVNYRYETPGAIADASCHNNKQDGDETGTDCGGSTCCDCNSEGRPDCSDDSESQGETVRQGSRSLGDLSASNHSADRG